MESGKRKWKNNKESGNIYIYMLCYRIVARAKTFKVAMILILIPDTDSTYDKCKI